MGGNDNNNLTMRIRATFAKTEPMRFTSHLDLYRAWERMLRRANLPLVFSQGFNPRPRLQLAAPLPLGMTSRCEIIDFWVTDVLEDAEAVKSDLIKSQPPGIEIQTVEFIDPNAPPLQKKAQAAEYTVDLLEPVSNLELKITELLDSDAIIRQRRDKTYDLRPLIKDLSLSPASQNGTPIIIMRLNAREGSTGRPEEVLLSLDIPPENTLIERTRLIFQG
jgi:radical SAM-linked protein